MALIPSARPAAWNRNSLAVPAGEGVMVSLLAWVAGLSQSLCITGPGEISCIISSRTKCPPEKGRPVLQSLIFKPRDASSTPVIPVWILKPAAWRRTWLGGGIPSHWAGREIRGWGLAVLIRDVRNLHHRRVLDGALVDELLHPEITPGQPPVRYSIAHARVLPGESTLPHRFAEATEVYYILEGHGVIHIGEESAPLSEGLAACVPPGSTQWIENAGEDELVFLAIVDPPWEPGAEEKVPRD